MGDKPGRSVGLPAGKKVEVLWSSFFFKEYIGSFLLASGGPPPPGAHIAWERNSDLPPWHTWGEHGVWHLENGRNLPNEFHAIVAGAYCNFWFTSSHDMVVNWR